MTAYYNEIDPFAAAWLRELIKAGHIAPGEVDERDIRDVAPVELVGFTQCHFFAGIGVWSHALRRAGWPDDLPIWTGSCPCQPFSTAGRDGGFADERHVWPAFFHLIEQHGPGVVIGEQVAAKGGLAWFDLISADMEAAGYAIGAVDLCAAGFGAPHIRQRLFWLAVAGGERFQGQQIRLQPGRPFEARLEASGSRGIGGLEYSNRDQSAALAGDAGEMCCVPEAQRQSEHGAAVSLRRGGDDRPAPTNGFWRDADWLGCTDERWRPVEPGTFPLAHGPANGLGRLRGYGNAINAEVATAFIVAAIDTLAVTPHHEGTHHG